MQRFGARRTATLLTIAVAAALLSGCATEAPKTVDTSTPDAAAPLFASDEEALAAAEEAYAKYQAAFDFVSASGGVDIAGLDAVAHGEALAGAYEAATQFRDSGIYTVGSTAFSTYKPQTLEYSVESSTIMTLYVCDERSALIPMESTGLPLETGAGESRLPFAVTITFEENKGLVLSKKAFWEGANYC